MSKDFSTLDQYRDLEKPLLALVSAIEKYEKRHITASGFADKQLGELNGAVDNSAGKSCNTFLADTLAAVDCITRALSEFNQPIAEDKLSKMMQDVDRENYINSLPDMIKRVIKNIGLFKPVIKDALVLSLCDRLLSKLPLFQEVVASFGKPKSTVTSSPSSSPSATFYKVVSPDYKPDTTTSLDTPPRGATPTP